VRITHTDSYTECDADSDARNPDAYSNGDGYSYTNADAASPNAASASDAASSAHAVTVVGID
jgi:hypothetical protein